MIDLCSVGHRFFPQNFVLVNSFWKLSAGTKFDRSRFVISRGRSYEAKSSQGPREEFKNKRFVSEVIKRSVFQHVLFYP